MEVIEEIVTQKWKFSTNSKEKSPWKNKNPPCKGVERKIEIQSCKARYEVHEEEGKKDYPIKNAFG